jgi:hypothetical protein
MNETPSTSGTDLADLADSQDIRFLLSGRIFPSGISIRRDRAELATVLDGSMEPDGVAATEHDLERTTT